MNPVKSRKNVNESRVIQQLRIFSWKDVLERDSQTERVVTVVGAC